MKSNFIKYDGVESIKLLQEVVDKANKKYEGKHTYKLIKDKDMLWVVSTNLEDYGEDGEANEKSSGVGKGYYFYFDIPENVPSWSHNFPSFGTCVEEYYLQYKKEMEL